MAEQLTPHSLAVLQCIVRSVTGPHLHDIEQATDGKVSVFLPAGDGRFEGGDTDEAFRAAVQISWRDSIDLQQPVPAQVAAVLLRWAGELMDLGSRIMDQVQPTSYSDVPLAFTVRDRLTGAESHHPFHSLAVEQQERLKAMHHSAVVTSRPASEVPEVARLFGLPSNPAE